MEEQPPTSIIIPAYNEEAGLPLVLEGICQEIALRNAEVIVVDDGSTDNTSLATEAFPSVRLIKHRANRGYGAAISTGVRAATGKYVIWFDADQQHQVSDLVKVVETLVCEDLDYCIGVRDATSHQINSRRLGKWILKIVVQIAAGRTVKDFNSGLRGFKREVIRRYLHLIPRGFGASTTTTLLMIERGYIGKEVLIHVKSRVGKSTVRQFRDGFQTLLLLLRIFLLFKAMLFFGVIGLVSILFGGIYGFYKALNQGLGFPVLASLMVIFGFQSIFFGLLADQISFLRRERFE